MLRTHNRYRRSVRRLRDPWAAGVLLLLSLGLAVLMLVPAEASPDARRATLVVETDETCLQGPHGPDRMVSTDTVAFMLPEGDGPLELKGTYRLTGSILGGYQMSGPSVYQGEVRDGALVLRFGQWYYKGKPMVSSDPEMPSEQNPVRIELEPDAKATIRFRDAHADKGVPCSGTVVYRLKMEEESQTWEAFLTGYRSVIHRSPEQVLKAGTKDRSRIDYFHGVTFSYALSTEFVITKKKGVWVYSSGSITKAGVEYEYMQRPELYKVNRTTCPKCNELRQLKGTPLEGDVLGNSSVVLHWRNIEPVVLVAAQLAVTCGLETEKATCEHLREYAEYSIADTDFLQRAAGHVLPLNETPISFKAGEPTPVGELAVVHEYKLRRVR